MKLRATVVHETSPKVNSLIVRFEKDEKKQHFEVKCSFNPHQQGYRKWDYLEMIIKWESETFEDPKTGEKSYFTNLTCDKAREISSPNSDK